MGSALPKIELIICNYIFKSEALLFGFQDRLYLPVPQSAHRTRYHTARTFDIHLSILSQLGLKPAKQEP